MDFLFVFGFSIFRLVRFRFLIRRSWVTSGAPPFLLFFFFWWISYFLVGFLFPVFWFWWVSYFPFNSSFLIFWLVRFVLSISSRSPWCPWSPRRELPSALVRAVVAPWDLAVSKFPAILDRYSRFSDARVFDFSFFLFWFSLASWISNPNFPYRKNNFLLLLWDFTSWIQRRRKSRTYMYTNTNAHIHVENSHFFANSESERRLSEVSWTTHV